MLKLLKKKEKVLPIVSPVSGTYIELKDISDNVFASGAMGEGFAVLPTSEEILSPVKGKVTSIFPTKHAISIKSDLGPEILVHLGVDTVELEGKPFEQLIQENTKVNIGQPIMKMDIEKVKEMGKSTEVIVVLPGMDLLVNDSLKELSAGDEIGTITVSEDE
ncbi:PTS sugar transporter subunit IIA [Lactobacillus terrae]|uniref:PTS sugar transporter subunit IIA n=1 Tax=Lactobacillus terrae TaxID=2269374 RepID=UPI000C1B6092|nr:PTS glucose transporter subunit IIA [Lactobacillus terrae]